MSEKAFRGDKTIRQCISSWSRGNKDAKKYPECIWIDGQEHRIPSELDQWRTEEKYDEATDKLKSLLDKKKALQTEELMNAVMKSSRSYEEILRYIQSDSSEEQEL